MCAYFDFEARCHKQFDGVQFLESHLWTLGGARGPQQRRGGAPDGACALGSRVGDWAILALEPRRAHARQRQSAGAPGVMAAKTFASRLRDSRRFLNSFLAGVVVGAAGSGLTALQFLQRRDAGSARPAKQPHGESGPAPSPGLGSPKFFTWLRAHTSPPLHP